MLFVFFNNSGTALICLENISVFQNILDDSFYATEKRRHWRTLCCIVFGRLLGDYGETIGGLLGDYWGTIGGLLVDY